MGWIREWGHAVRLEMSAFARWLWFGHPAGRTPWLRRVLAIVFVFLLPVPVLLLLVFRLVPIPGTPEMLIDLVTLNPVHYQWRAYDEIAPSLPRAVIGAEDENFCSHNGFDWKAIDDAWRAHQRHPHRLLHGASTISQQTARTLFLVPTRSWARKSLEAWLTVLVEAMWPKKRILTAYLNLVDWGHGNFGAEAAAQAYFHKSAAALNSTEAARLAAILPNPDGWRAANPGPYVSRRTGRLMSRSDNVSRDGLDWCVTH